MNHEIIGRSGVNRKTRDKDNDFSILLLYTVSCLLTPTLIFLDTNIFNLFLLSTTNFIVNTIQQIINRIDYIQVHSIDIKLELNKHPQQIIYQTPICFVIAKKNKIDTFLFAQKISNHFNKSYQDNNLIATVSGQGWLEFLVSDRLIEQYLNNLLREPFIVQNQTQLPINQPIQFIDYYLHARCCSLLISGHQQGIITMNKLDFSLNNWQIIKPENIAYRLFYQGDFLEQKIIKQILLFTEKKQQNKLLLKPTLESLKELFFSLESIASIWGKTLTENEQLSQARLGLIALILHYYQNIFYCQYHQTLPIQI